MFFNELHQIKRLLNTIQIYGILNREKMRKLKYEIIKIEGTTMAFEVTKVYKEQFPALRFIGKRYTNDDRVNGNVTLDYGNYLK